MAKPGAEQVRLMKAALWLMGVGLGCSIALCVTLLIAVHRAVTTLDQATRELKVKIAEAGPFQRIRRPAIRNRNSPTEAAARVFIGQIRNQIRSQRRSDPSVENSVGRSIRRWPDGTGDLNGPQSAAPQTPIATPEAIHQTLQTYYEAHPGLESFLRSIHPDIEKEILKAPQDPEVMQRGIDVLTGRYANSIESHIQQLNSRDAQRR